MQKREWTKRLYFEYDQIVYAYRVILKKPLIKVFDMKSRWAHWDPVTRCIVLSSRLIKASAWSSVVEILKHEMAHQIVSEIIQVEESHGESFNKACNMLGVLPWARKAAIHIPANINSLAKNELSSEDKSLYRRIEKLLSLSSSSNQHESIAALKKVNELYKKYRISSGATLKDDFIHIIINHKKQRLESFHSSISSILTSYYRVQIIFNSEFDPHKLCEYKTIEILGGRKEVKLAEYVYWFLFNNLKILWNNYSDSAGVSGRAERNQFYIGVLKGFESKLKVKDTFKDVEVRQEMTSLIKVDEKSLATFLKTRFPRLRVERRYYGSYYSHTYTEGKRQGTNLNLYQGINNKSKQQNKLLLKGGSNS